MANDNRFNEEKENAIFAVRLRELFEVKKATHNELADFIKAKTGDSITRQAVGQWCNGNTCPNLKTVPFIADFFNVSADYLLGRSDVKSVDPSRKINIACEVTNLNEDAVKVLNSLQNESNHILLSKEIVSELISHRMFKDFVNEISRTIQVLNSRLDNSDKKWLEFAELMRFKYSDINELSEIIAKSYSQSAGAAAAIIIDDVILSHTGKHTLAFPNITRE